MILHFTATLKEKAHLFWMLGLCVLLGSGVILKHCIH